MYILLKAKTALQSLGTNSPDPAFTCVFLSSQTSCYLYEYVFMNTSLCYCIRTKQSVQSLVTIYVGVQLTQMNIVLFCLINWYLFWELVFKFS